MRKRRAAPALCLTSAHCLPGFCTSPCRSPPQLNSLFSVGHIQPPARQHQRQPSQLTCPTERDAQRAPVPSPQPLAHPKHPTPASPGLAPDHLHGQQDRGGQVCQRRMFSLSPPQVPSSLGRTSELRGEKKVVPAFGFFGVPGSGLGAEPVGTAGAGMRRDRREREVCPALSHAPQKPPAGGRTPRASAGAPERGASAGEGSNRK